MRGLEAEMAAGVVGWPLAGGDQGSCGRLFSDCLPCWRKPLYCVEDVTDWALMGLNSKIPTWYIMGSLGFRRNRIGRAQPVSTKYTITVRTFPFNVLHEYSDFDPRNGKLVRRDDTNIPG